MMDRRLILKRIVMFSLVVMTIGLFYFIYSHGFLVAENYTKGNKVDYVRLSSNLSQTPGSSTDTSTFIPSGEYSVSSTRPEGSFIETLTVPTFLRNVSTSKGGSYPLTETVTRNSLPYLFMSPSGIISTDLNDKMRTPSRSAISNDNYTESSIKDFPLYTESVQINASTVCGILGTDPVQPSCFNVASGDMTYFKPILSKKSRLEIGDQRFAVFDTDSNTSYLYDIQSKNEKSIKISSKANISKNNGKPLVSTSESSIAIVEGKDISSTNDNDEKIKGSNQALTILDAKSKQQITRKVFDSALIIGVSLSVDGNSIAVTTPTQTAFYDVKDLSKPGFIIPYVARSFYWLDGNNVIAATDSDGVFDVKIKDRSANSIIPYHTVRPTQLSFVSGGALYFSGYVASIKGKGDPSGFRVPLNTPGSSSSMNALKRFPYQGDGFYIDVIDRTVFIQTTRYIDGVSSEIDTRSQEQALKYVRSHIKNIGDYKVSYVYVDFDLNETAEDLIDD
jgi:hypothetical protein